MHCGRSGWPAGGAFGRGGSQRGPLPGVGFVIPAFHIQALEWYILAVAVILGAISGIGPA